ncbi:MAG: very short patch repair endonuclease [Candidatus Omnitrophica bacterium]|nr:very short patch repair endonuclease [Candidatus Omnitrophota bacterium]
MDNLTPAQRRKNMQNIRSAGTKAELFLAKELRKRKIYFAKNVKSILGKPDFVFRKKKTVVFVDSDFWHGHPKRCIMPKSNHCYWNAKIKRNKQRDRLVSRGLKKAGWNVIRIWEYDLKHNFDSALSKILLIV